MMMEKMKNVRKSSDLPTPSFPISPVPVTLIHSMIETANISWPPLRYLHSAVVIALILHVLPSSCRYHRVVLLPSFNIPNIPYTSISQCDSSAPVVGLCFWGGSANSVHAPMFYITHSYICRSLPSLGKRCSSWNRHATSAYTWMRANRGPQASWLHHTGKALRSSCPCGHPRRDSEHITFHCPILSQPRATLLQNRHTWEKLDSQVYIKDNRRRGLRGHAGIPFCVKTFVKCPLLLFSSVRLSTFRLYHPRVDRLTCHRDAVHSRVESG